jgi:hypothetical protein
MERQHGQRDPDLARVFLERIEHSGHEGSLNRMKNVSVWKKPGSSRLDYCAGSTRIVWHSRPRLCAVHSLSGFAPTIKAELPGF